MGDKPKLVTWTHDTAVVFKAAYTELAKTLPGNAVFVFEGNEFVMDYAKYLIQYLETQFGELTASSVVNN